MTATERDRETARRQRIATVIGRRVDLAVWPVGFIDPAVLVDAVDALVVQLLAAERARVLAPIQAVADEWDTLDDARLGINRIAKATAARTLRAAIEEGGR